MEDKNIKKRIQEEEKKIKKYKSIFKVILIRIYTIYCTVWASMHNFTAC